MEKKCPGVMIRAVLSLMAFILQVAVYRVSERMYAIC